MRQAERPPVAHLVLLAVVGLAFLIGGTLTIQEWGQLQVRPLTAYLALAVTLHAASRFAGGASLVLRSAAWLVVALMPLHLDVLLRAEVLVPALALGVVDVAQHRTSLEADVELPAGSLAKGIAGLATVGALALVGVLAVLARSTLVAVRLAAVVAAGWALVSGFALRPAIRTPANLLAGAGAFALTFALLAGPVVPLGPLTTYWASILAVAAAVLTSTFTRSEAALRGEHRVHEQTVRSLPDPLLAPLADRVHDFVNAGEGAEELSRRVEAARGEEPTGRRLQRRARQRSEEGTSLRRARMRALADELDVDLTEIGGDPL